MRSDHQLRPRNKNGPRAFRESLNFKERKIMFHKENGCIDCKFAPDKNSIFVWHTKKELKEHISKKPAFVGLFTLPGWVGHSGFYLFKCGNCGKTVIDHPHGYTEHGLLFLRCDSCEVKFSIKPNKI